MLIHASSLTPVELTSAIVREPLIVTPDATVIDAIAQMSGVRTLCLAERAEDSHLAEIHSEARSSCVLIVEDGQLLGIFTERDVVRLSAQKQALENLPIQQVMARSVITLRETSFTDLFSAINLLQLHRIRHLPLVDERNAVVGLLTHETLRQTSRPVDLLQMRLASEVMTVEVICAEPWVSMLDVAGLMATHHVSSVVITQTQMGDQQELLQIPIGLVTERDMVQFRALNLDLEACLAQSVMSTPMFSVRADDSLWVVQQTMAQRYIRRLAVTGSQGELLGIVTQTSLLKALNPIELHRLAEMLGQKVVQLEAEKIELLESRTVELEQQVEERTSSLKSKIEREKLLAALSTQIQSSLSLQTILQTTVEEVRRLLGCDRVNIWQFKDDWVTVAVAESTDSPISLVGEEVSDTCFKQERAELYRQGKVSIVADIYKSKMADCHRALLERLQTRAKIVVPLLCGSDLWGLLNVTESQHARDWQTEEVELLQTLAVQLAIALQQATTYKQLQDELSARRETEARLRESEQRYITLNAAAPVGIFSTDIDGNCTYVNDRWCQITGISREATLGDGWQQGLHPEDRLIVAEEWHKATQEKRHFQLEYRFQRPDGTITWVYGQSAIDRNANGDVVGYIGTLTDISDRKRIEDARKQAEIALKASEQSLSTLISNLPGYIYRVHNDPNYTPVFISSGVEAITGYRQDEYLVERTISCGQEIHPDDADGIWEIVQGALSDRQSYECEYRIITKTGVEKWVWERGRGIYLEDGTLAYLEGFVTDVTDRKHAEVALIESEAHQRALVHAIPDLIMRVNRAGIYLEFVATPTFRVVGNLDQLVGTHVSQSLPSDLAHRRMKWILQALQTRTIQIYEQDLSTQSRTQIEEVRVVPYSNDEVLILVRDISDRKQTETALQNLIAGTAATTGQDFFPALASHIAEALHVSYALVTELIDQELHVLAFWANGALQPTFSYHPAQTPCEKTLQNGQFYCESFIQQQFPYDSDLVEMEAHSYLGIALKDSKGQAIGNLCILDQQTIQAPQRAEQILQVFAARAGAEIERQRANAALQQLNQTLESQIEQRTAELHEREAQLQDFFDNANDLIQSVLLDTGRFEYVNRAWREVLGYSAAEIQGLTIFDVLHPNCQHHCRETIAQMQVGQLNPMERIELTFISKNKREVVVEGSINCRFDGDRPVATRAIFRDITARKQAELAQHASQQLLKTVLDTFPLYVFWKNRDLVYLGCNQNFATISGCKFPTEIVGKTDYDLPWGVNEAHLYRADDREVMELGIAKLGIIETLTQVDGTQIWLETNKIPLRDLGGDVIGVVCTFQDISDRKRAEIELAKSRQQYYSLIQSVNGIVWEYDLSVDQFSFVSNKAEELLGYSIHDWLTKPNFWRDHVYSIDLAEAERVFNDAIQNQKSCELEYRMVAADGSLVWVYDVSSLHFEENGDLSAFSGVLIDIRDRKAAEQTIHQQIERETLLREITQRIRQSLDIQTIFDTACQEIRQVLQADRVGIFKFYPDSNFDDGEFVAESFVPGLPTVLNIRIHDHCFGENYSSLYAKGRSYVIDDIYAGEMSKCHAGILAQFGVRANLVVPLLCGDTLWGLLCIHQCANPRHWQQFEIDLTQQLATQLAIAIQQANLYEQIQAELWERQQAEARIALQLRRQETLGEIIQQIRESLNIDEILATVTKKVKDVMHSDRVIVFRLFADGNSQIVEEAVSEGLPTLKDRSWANEVWSQEILDCYWQGKPRIVPDVTNDVWTHCLLDYSSEGQIQSKIVAPILQDVRNSENHRWVSLDQPNKLWGVLIVHACQEKRVWQESEAQLLQQIANQLAIAIQQANLFSQLQQELTERQQAETKLTESNKQLAVSNHELARATRLKDEFLANMSHELRTPLNAILGMTEGLQEQVFGPVNEPQLKALRTVERSGSHLLELINDILDVAKIESGQIELDYSLTAVAPLCKSSLAFIKQQALKKRIRLDLNLQPPLPDLLVDERRIRQVLINLLNNAVKFTPEGGHITLEVNQIPSNITFAGLPIQNMLRFSVIDTGIGIAPENIKRLFQPFIQIDSALNRQYSGTGLGLTLVKRIVEIHGGRVQLTSELGVGSCVMVDLPYYSNRLSKPEPDAFAPQPPPSEVGSLPDYSAVRQPPLILLAEDNEANVITISSYFKAKGYEILLAKNGRDAVALAIAQQPDLILMDIQMPGMDGLEAIQQIRCNHALADVPIVALTALAMTGDRDRCLAAGANDYLTKPVKLKQLATTIQELLERKEINP